MSERAGEAEASSGIDSDVDTVLREFRGDPKAAIRALLHYLEALARDYGSSVSRGYVRREVRTAVSGQGETGRRRP